MKSQTFTKRLFRIGQPFINPAKDLIDEEAINEAARPFLEERLPAPGLVAINIFANGFYLLAFVWCHPTGSWWPGPWAFLIFPLLGVGLPLLVAYLLRLNIWRSIVRAVWGYMEGEIWEWVHDYGFPFDELDRGHTSNLEHEQLPADLADWLQENLPGLSIQLKKMVGKEAEKLRFNYNLYPKSGLSTIECGKAEIDEVVLRINSEFFSKRQFDLSVALWVVVLINLALMLVVW